MTAKIMGILNCTPDSFYDGAILTVDERVEKGLRLIADGAQIIDVGGESSRPYSRAISVEEEINRVVPVIKKLRQYTDCVISIDTVKSAVASAALSVGANIINDISAGENDQQMFSTAQQFSAPIILMHRQGTTATMQNNPQYHHVVEEVIAYLHQRVNLARKFGLTAIVDVGFGFGKTTEHNWELFNALPKICAEFHEREVNVLIGVSNKSMFGGEISTRENASTAAEKQAINFGVDIIRTHHPRGLRKNLYPIKNKELIPL